MLYNFAVDCYFSNWFQSNKETRGKRMNKNNREIRDVLTERGISEKLVDIVIGVWDCSFDLEHYLAAEVFISAAEKIIQILEAGATEFWVAHYIDRVSRGFSCHSAARYAYGVELYADKTFRGGAEKCFETGEYLPSGHHGYNPGLFYMGLLRHIPTPTATELLDMMWRFKRWYEHARAIGHSDLWSYCYSWRRADENFPARQAMYFADIMMSTLHRMTFTVALVYAYARQNGCPHDEATLRTKRFLYNLGIVDSIAENMRCAVESRWPTGHEMNELESRID